MNDTPDPNVPGRQRPVGSDAPAPRRSIFRPSWRWAFVALGLAVLLAAAAVVGPAALGRSWSGSPLSGRTPGAAPAATGIVYPWLRVEPGTPAPAQPAWPTPRSGDAAGAQSPDDGPIAALERLLAAVTAFGPGGASPVPPTAAATGSAPSPAPATATPRPPTREPAPPPADTPLPPPTDTPLPPPPTATPTPPPPTATPTPPPPTATPTPPPPTATPTPPPTSTPTPPPPTLTPPPTDPVLVTLCHKPGTPAQQTLAVPPGDVPGHLGHGDYLGPCL